MAGLGWTLPAVLAAMAVFLLILEGVRRNPRLKLRMAWESMQRRMGLRQPLCRTCRWNHPQDCSRRNRPFATFCEDYKRR
jgi:hypothetical protein